jgi:hypothetical protein
LTAVGVAALPSPAPTGYGGPSIVVAAGTVAGSPTPTAAAFTISGVGTSATPAAGAWVGQRAFRPATGEYRYIATHTVSGTLASATHALGFSGSGLNGPFASAPAAGESIVIS